LTSPGVADAVAIETGLPGAAIDQDVTLAERMRLSSRVYTGDTSLCT
jgi:hypothetical protein